MNFKEMFKKYENDTASDVERQIVEEEIEKNKLINEYIVGSLEDLFFEDEDINFEIKERVSSKLRRNILYSVVIVILLYVSLTVIISPMIDSLYYNPTKVTQGKIMKDLTFDMVAYTELNVPGYDMMSSLVDQTGYGTYDIILRRNNTFDNNEERIPISLKRNEREGFFDYLFSYDIEPKSVESERGMYDYEMPLNDLKIENNYASVFITFNNSVSLVEARYLEETYNQIFFKWMSIDHGNDMYSKIGFKPISSISYGDKPDEEKYPLFFLDDMYKSIMSVDGPLEMFYAENYEKHFRTLLNYMIDREDFIEVFDKNNTRMKFYKETLEYIDENGIQVEGLLIYGETKDLAKFIESIDVYGIQILDMKTSKYSR